ncbi:MAG: HAD family phosphatase [Kiritimatiellales bacterium]|nr:HAD family phosphatase [Kiritimatiellales bacterium]
MYKYLLWDHDGVIVDTEKWYFRANRDVLASLGFELTQEMYLALSTEGGSCWDFAREHGLTNEDVRNGRMRRNELYKLFLANKPIDIPGAEEVIRSLSQNYRMAIVTTSAKDDFKLIHANRTITSHFEFILALGDYPRTKPYPDPYLAALDRFNASPVEALVIEDSARGLKAANAAGIDCIIVHNEFTHTQDFSTAKAVINSLQELPALLAG